MVTSPPNHGTFRGECGALRLRQGGTMFAAGQCAVGQGLVGREMLKGRLVASGYVNSLRT